MPVFAWIALAVFLVATIASTTFAVARGVRAWLTFRHFRRTLARRLGEVTRGIDGAEAKLARAAQSAARVEQARTDLQESLAVASVLAASAGDARVFLRVLGFLRA